MDGRKRADKQSIRSKYLARRNELTRQERLLKSRKIWSRLKEEETFKEAEVLLVYMDYRSEVITTPFVEELLEDGNKKIFAPTVEGMDITFYEVTSLKELTSGYQGIMEPMTGLKKQFDAELMKKYKCLLLVPGTVFDRNLSRMGYGKGFYDRFLEKNKGMTKAALAFSCQIARQIPVEVHDIKMDMILTEDEIIR